MSARRPLSARRKRLTEWLLAATAVGVVGCSAPRPLSFPTFFSDADNATRAAAPLDEPAPQAEPAQPAAVKTAVKVEQVGFDDSEIIDSGQPSGGASVRLAEPFLGEPEQATFGGPGTADSAVMTLADFESLALMNNPTIQELVATTQKAAGFRTQVGLRANPTVGYQATQLADEGTDQHTLFISQTFVTGDKLELNRRVLNEALRAQLLQLEAQKYRVATDIRVTFFAALAWQRRIQLIRDFQSVADQGLELSELRKEAMEGSQLEVVQANVQKNEIDLALQQAEIRYAAAWRELAALSGSPHLPPAALQGTLPESEPAMDWSLVASTMIASSPEYQAAQTRIAQARANLHRQCVQPIPNLDVQLAAGSDNATDGGLINLQVGLPLPVHNRNQGNIAAARAELTRASREADRIENSIQSRLAAVSSQYDASLAAVAKYSKEILPNAADGLKLAETAYKAGETSFVQVLVARRSYYDTNLAYLTSQTDLAQARARVEGYVLEGALEAVVDNSGDASLRDLTFGQQ